MRRPSRRRSSPPAAPTAAALLALVLLVPGSVAAQERAEPTPTRLLVRAVAHDAKVIGSGVGGARITVREAATGRILARGVQRGGTGDTERIMQTPRERGDEVYGVGQGVAGFRATLMLRSPTRVEVVAEGPLSAPKASRQAVSKTLWMVPGRHVEGEGLVLELHGFLVEILAPTSEATTAGELQVRARVRMMCGCPTRPGGMWNSDRYELVARVLRDGRPVGEAPLRFAGEASHYEAVLPVTEPGTVRVEVLVIDSARANVGRDVRSIRVSSP